MKYIPSTGPICREAHPFGLPLFVAAVALILLGHPAMGAVAFLGGVFVYWFFRNPDRTGPVDDRLVWSPADGKVVGAGIVPMAEMPGGQCLKISIFLSLVDVHVAWSPVGGTVTASTHIPGKFLNAMNEKCAEENERKVLDMRCSNGDFVRVVLIAGLVARRIVCPIEPGDEVQRGEKIGLIRFGSRTEIYLPADYELLTGPGQRVSGSSTPLARAPGRQSAAA